MTSKRLFIAVNITPEIREKIAAEVLPELKGEGLKPVKKENLHLTLRFIGYVPEEKLGDFIKVVSGLKCSPFMVSFSGFSHFRKRVLFIDIKEGAGQLESLSNQINSALGTEEPFTAHLTIARNKGMRAKEFSALVESLNKKGFSGSFTVKSVELMESRLSREGPEYSVVYSFSFSEPRTSSSSSSGLM
jgi:2'-5' RNA ligase